MPNLVTPKDLRSAQRLPFCYLCGAAFVPDDNTNSDHVPPKSVFAKQDRMPLVLATHYECNSGQKKLDERIAQLIGLKRGYQPSNPRDRHLRFMIFPQHAMGAVTNVNIDEAVWRWIRGFHAALYRQPLPRETRGALVTPFARSRVVGNKIIVDPITPQHYAFVETIKTNRAKRNLDRISCNAGKLTYECVWCQSDEGPWMCIFALDLYGWKELGEPRRLRSRGCAGFYVLASGAAPESAARGVRSPIIVPNLDLLDPFGR